jgi:hypothetical protein
MMKSGYLIATLAIGLSTALVACQGKGGQSASQPHSSQAPGSVQESMAQQFDLNQQLAFSRQHLSTRLDIALTSVRIMGTRQVTWRSGALGCPKPGEQYTEALVPGVLILLQADGTIYGYHAKTGGQPFHCPEERVQTPASIQEKDLA